MEWLLSLDPEAVRGWLTVLAGLVALVGAYRHMEGESRWRRVRALIPDAHRLAQRAAAMTNTTKDDEFLRQLSRLLAAFDIELSPREADAARAMGSAEHQTYKLLRDGSDPLEAPDEE